MAVEASGRALIGALGADVFRLSTRHLAGLLGVRNLTTFQDGMMVFPLIPYHEFRKSSPRYFELYSVWAEYYEPSDIDEIVSWGIPREPLWQQVLGMLDKKGDFLFPVLRDGVFPGNLIFIKAAFETPTGVALNGCIIGHTTDPHAFEVYLDEKTYFFNVNMHGLADETAEELAVVLGLTADELFPLTFVTESHDEDGELIAGSFDLFQ